MATTESRIAALEQVKGERIEIVRVGTDGVARDSNGQPMPPGWDKCKGLITIVRSYGVKQ
jgi:hypothetical protein